MQGLFAFNGALPQGWIYEADVRAKMLVGVVASIAAVAVSSVWGLLFMTVCSLGYALSLRRLRPLLWAYALIAIMCLLALGCTWLMGLAVPALMKNVGAADLLLPFLRVLVMVHVILPLALSSRMQGMLDALRGLRLPFCVYLPAAVTLRFIPTFLYDIRQVTESLRLRGHHVSPWSLTRHPLLGLRLLCAPLLFRALRTSEDLGIAAELKGLGHGERMTPYRPDCWKRGDSLLVGGALLVGLLSLTLQWLLGASASVMP